MIITHSVNSTQIHPDQTTLITGWIFHPTRKIRLNRRTLIRAFTKPVCIIVCPWCGEYHVHGWDDNDPGPHTRIAHCYQVGMPWRAGYTIDPIAADDYIPEGWAIVDFKKFLSRLAVNTQYRGCK